MFSVKPLLKGWIGAEVLLSSHYGPPLVLHLKQYSQPDECAAIKWMHIQLIQAYFLVYFVPRLFNVRSFYSFLV